MPSRSTAALIASGALALAALLYLLGMTDGIGPAIAVGIGAAAGGWLGWTPHAPRRPWPPRA